MDIYQIIITHNKGWTNEEAIYFGIILLLLAGILITSVYKHKIPKLQAIAVLLLTGVNFFL